MDNLKVIGEWDDIKVYAMPLDSLVENDWNPNEQSPETLNALTEEIEEEGFDAPIQVCPVEGEDNSFRIIGGAHRFRAMKYLGKETIPVVIKEDWNDEVQKIKTMRRNLLAGKTNPKKFTELVNSLQDQYSLDRDVLIESMGFRDENEFLKYYQEEKEKRSEAEQALMDEMQQEVQVIDNLSSIIAELMRTFGDTLPSGILGFYFKNNPVFLVSCNGRLANAMHKFLQKAEEGADIREEFLKILEPAVMGIKLDKKRPTYIALEGLEDAKES